MDNKAFYLGAIILLISLVSVGCSYKPNYAPVKRTKYSVVSGRAKAKYYTVKKGDTLYSIGFRYGYSYLQLAKWNNISAPHNIYVGQKIKLFGAKSSPKKSSNNLKKPLKRRPASHKQTKKPRNTSQKKPTVSKAKKKLLKFHWQWPIRGKLVKTFSQTGNKGIDIGGKIGQPIKAAEAGKVVYSGNGLVGYGNLLIIKHNYLYLSAYANNRRLLVKEGQDIKKGQVIAEMGLGKGKQATLHFEIRKNGKSVNPLNYLP